MGARLLAVVVMVGGGAARGWEAPQAHDYVLLGASFAVNAADMWLSFDIAAFRWVPAAGYYSVQGCVVENALCRKEYLRQETNPLLVTAFGPHPPRGAYVETAIWLYVSERNRWLVPVIAMVVEGVVIYGNLRSGLTFHF